MSHFSFSKASKMCGEFFATGIATDPNYNKIREGEAPILVQARQFVEQLWCESRVYVDKDLPQRSRESFHARFWEMYLATSLLKKGISLLPKEQITTRKRGGPDFKVAQMNAWIEAVAPEAGTELEVSRVEPSEDLGIDATLFDVPHDAIKVRFRSAIHDKHQKYQKYRQKGVVSAEEPYVIAINGALIPYVRLERSVPRIVSCLFPFGDDVVHIDRKSNKLVGHSFTYQGWVAKKNQERISTTVFQDPLYNGISAVLYSAVDVINHHKQMGADFVLIHNPLALNPLPLGFLELGKEYKVELGQETSSAKLIRNTYHV